TQRSVISGHPTAAVALLIDGRRTLSDLLVAALPAIGEAETIFAIEELNEAGFLTTSADPSPPGQAVFWSELGLDPAVGSVEVDTVGTTPSAWHDAMIRALAAAGVSVRAARHADPPSLRVALTSDYRSPELEGYAQRHRAERVAWLPVKPCGTKPLFGPIF